MKIETKDVFSLGSVLFAVHLLAGCILGGKNESALRNSNQTGANEVVESNASTPDDDELAELPSTAESCAAGEKPFDYSEPSQTAVPASGSGGGGQKVMTAIAHFPLTLKISLPGTKVYEPVPPGTRFLKLLKGDRTKLDPKLISEQFRHIIIDTEVVIDTRFDALAQNMQACDGTTLFHYSTDPSKTKMCSNGLQLPEQQITTMFVWGNSPFAKLLDTTPEGSVPTSEIVRYFVNELKNASLEETKHGAYLNQVPESFRNQFQSIKKAEIETATKAGKKPAFPSFMVLKTAPFMSFNRAESICQLKDVQVFLKKPQVTCHRVSESLPGFPQWEGIKYDERVASILKWVLGTLLGEVQQGVPKEERARVEVVAPTRMGRFHQVLAERVQTLRESVAGGASEMVNARIQQPVRDLIQDKFLAQGITGFIQGFLGCQSTTLDNIIP